MFGTFEKDGATRDAYTAREAVQLRAEGWTSVQTSKRVPPRTGAGSGKDAWAEYAEAHGVAGEGSREDIIAALEVAGVPTE